MSVTSPRRNDAEELPPPHVQAAAQRPRLRGHIHYWSFLATLVAGTALISLSAAQVSGFAALTCSVYVATVLGMFGVSALYHRRIWVSYRVYMWMKRLDHSMIFLFIAGTYTPFTLLAMPQPTGWIVLAVVWTGALAGVMLKLFWPDAPRWLGVIAYNVVGWVAVFVLPELAESVGIAALVLLLAGGVLYTTGALMYAMKKPTLWPKVFGYHEMFHAFVTAAALCHMIAIWFCVYSYAG
ncbi:PAQR family membrane homeostasis protein TrhA [Thermocrispum agreste]|uniref:PAQR family membrane homeostasis protein TrhA n=1 Tax=Thermocrispum agreste TaxID=37925 RepID=UPI00056F3DF7